MNRIPPALILVLVMVPYLRLANASWAWDDYGLLLTNHAISDPSWEKIWQRDLWCCIQNKEVPSAYYRPLTTLSFLLDYQIGLRPGLAHLHSILWHLVNVFLVYGLLKRPTGEKSALIGAVFFGLHPIQSEAVAWVAARNDLMAATFVMATLYSLENKRYSIAFISTLLGCLSKESAYLMPGYYLGWSLAFTRPDTSIKQVIKDLSPILLAILCALLLRSQATLGTPPTTRIAVDNLATSLANATITQLGWISIPWPLITTLTIYNTDVRPLSYLGLVITLLLLIRVVRTYPRQSLGLLGLALLAYAPTAGGIYWFGTLGERYLYLPMLGIAALVAQTPTPLWARVGWLGMSVGILWVRVPEWNSSMTLWKAAISRAPDANSYQLLGSEYYRVGRWPESLAAYETSLGWTPKRLFSCTHVSTLATRVLSNAEVEARLEGWQVAGCRRIQGFDMPITIWYLRQGRWKEAEAWLRSAQQVDPERRDRAVKGAIALWDGDLTLTSSEYVIAPNPSGYLDTLYSYKNHRSQDSR